MAISGAMYCVVVSMWWVMSPVKMNPGRKKKTHIRQVTKWLKTAWKGHFRIKTYTPPVAMVTCLR